MKKEIIEKLQSQILSMQGFSTPLDNNVSFGLGPIELAFPNRTFPLGVVHEFLSSAAEEASATSGFISALLGRLMERPGPSLWISSNRTVFPPALRYFGVDPSRIIFIDLPGPKDTLWAIEEALKCEGLSAVVAEVSDIDFTASRRLQLAAEHSRVTALMHCAGYGKAGNTTSVARWRVRPVASVTPDGMPGVGYPHWNIELTKIRNGRPGRWRMEWAAGRLRPVLERKQTTEVSFNKTA